MASTENCPSCKWHSGVAEALDHLKGVQADRNETFTRVWQAIESKVSVKVFLSILSVSVATLGIIIGALFYNQGHTLSTMASAQSQVLDQMIELKVDMGIIKHRLNNAEGMPKRGAGP